MRIPSEAFTAVVEWMRVLMIIPSRMHCRTDPTDPEVKDDWGQPAVRITYRNHPDDLKNMAFFRERALELLQAAGAKKHWGWPVEEVTSSVHLMGTCRMGNDPKASVVNRYHRAHDVPNLFVVDGSSLVTSGRNQPTCTIQALAYRAADNMVQAAKKGEIPFSF